MCLGISPFFSGSVYLGKPLKNQAPDRFHTLNIQGYNKALDYLKVV